MFFKRRDSVRWSTTLGASLKALRWVYQYKTVKLSSLASKNSPSIRAC